MRQTVDPILDRVLALPRLLELAVHSRAAAVELGAFDLLADRLDVAAPDAALQGLGETSFEDLGEAAQLGTDRLRLADQCLEHAILGTLDIEEVAAENLGRWL